MNKLIQITLILLLLTGCSTPVRDASTFVPYSEPGLSEIGDSESVDKEPIPVSRTLPSYPKGIVTEVNFKGRVEVEFIVKEDGKIGEIAVLKSPDQAFADQTKAAMATWIYKPAKKNGVPVPYVMKLSMDFDGKFGGVGWISR